jgi:phage I-like protein
MGGMATHNTTPLPQFFTGAHAIALPDVAVGQKVPEWVELLPAGEFGGRDGRGPYRTDIPLVLKWFAAWGMPISGDYEHQSLRSEENGLPAPATGWCHDLEERNGAVWGRIDWTERAAAWIAAKEYLYISPVFDHWPDGTVFRLIGWALTNQPNLFITAIARRQPGNGSALPASQSLSQSHHSQENAMPGPLDQERASELLRGLIYRLSLPETSTPDEVLAAVTRVTDSLSATQAAMATIRTALALPADATTEAVVSAAQSIHSRQPASSNPGDFVPRTEFDRVSHTLNQMQQAQQAERVDQAVTAAMTAGKVSPGLRDWATAYATRDLAGFNDFVAAAPAIVGDATTSSHARGTPPVGAGATNPLLADAERRCQR